MMTGNDQQQPLFPPQPLPHPPQRRSRIRMIQQQSPPLLLHPQLLLLPQKHIRMMSQRIQLQEFPPRILFPALFPQPQLFSQPHPHLSSPQPQFAAAKSLITKILRNLIYTPYYVCRLSCVTLLFVIDRKNFFKYTQLNDLQINRDRCSL